MPSVNIVGYVSGTPKPFFLPTSRRTSAPSTRNGTLTRRSTPPVTAGLPTTTSRIKPSIAVFVRTRHLAQKNASSISSLFQESAFIQGKSFMPVTARTIGWITFRRFHARPAWPALTSTSTSPVSFSGRAYLGVAQGLPTRPPAYVSSLSPNAIFWPAEPFRTRKYPHLRPSACFSRLSPLSSPYRETDSYDYKRAALYDYLENEPVLQILLQELSSMYRVCEPDGSCGI